MTDTCSAFIHLAIKNNVLKFGEFTLKSGRVSPYFFNAGLFCTAESIALLGDMYAQTIVDSGVQFDVLFGPAYKGIPLAAVTAASLYHNHKVDTGWAYNRKETKSHGEGGVLVGAPLEGKVLVIDDVITAGTAINESIRMIEANNAEFAGVIIALNRQEKGSGSRSAIDEISEQHDVPVVNVASLDDMIRYLDRRSDLQDELDAILAYRKEFGTTV